jgi:hypothetical protein
MYSNPFHAAVAEIWQGHYYRMYELSMNWEEARTYAATLSHHDVPGHLIVISSEDESNYINSITASGTEFWISLTDMVRVLVVLSVHSPFLRHSHDRQTKARLCMAMVPRPAWMQLT